MLDDLQGLRFTAHPTKPSIAVGYVFFQVSGENRVKKYIDNITCPRGLSDTRLCYNFIRRLAL